jgi:outer membrane protein insertion porin family
VDGELKKAAEAAIGMKPNFAYTLKEVKADMQHVFDLGYFSKATPTPEDTRDGVKLIIEVLAQSLA